MNHINVSRWLILGVFGMPLPAPAQEFRLIGGGTHPEISHEFTRLKAIYELPDGRVLVVDEGDALIGFASFPGLSFAPLGRRGAGPKEYGTPSDALALGGDSVGVVDWLHRRILVITRTGTVSGFVSPEMPVYLGCQGAGAERSDERGFLYSRGQAVRRNAAGTPIVTDSNPILRWPAGKETIEVVASAPRKRQVGEVAVSPCAVTVPPGGPFPAMETSALWTVDREGRVAVVSDNPYQVIFVSPSGSRDVGPVISYRRAAVTDSVKRAYMSEMHATQTLIVDANGRVSSRRSGEPAREPRVWGDAVPPFRPEAFLAFDRTDVLWIQRSTFGREGGRYDLIGPEGSLVDRIRLPEGHRVIGFGRDAMYVVRRDADDLEYLQRWPRPARR